MKDGNRHNGQRFGHLSSASVKALSISLLLAAASWLVGAGEDSPISSSARLIATTEPGWPQWRGPRRDGICDETGLLQQWPKDGPPLRWKSPNLGRGYSSPILAGGAIYLTGEANDELRVYALDLNGKLLWESRNGKAWTGPYPGARACCAYSRGRLYHMNAYGRVVCLQAATGKEIWSVDIISKFGGKIPTWGLGECLLVDGPRLFVTPGGTKALLAALDTQTGETLWTTEPLSLGKSSHPAHERLAEPAGEFDSAGYASPILFELGGRHHLVTTSLRHAFGVDADTGRLLWTRPMPTTYSVIAATPVLIGDGVFITAPDTTEGGKFFGLQYRGSTLNIETRWKTALDTCHGCLVCFKEDLYGSWYRKNKGLACLNSRNGEVRYQAKDVAMGSMLYADNRLYYLGQDGEMTLVQPSPQGFGIRGRFRLVPGRVSDAWAHPVILEGRLYLRYHETLYCYTIAPSYND